MKTLRTAAWLAIAASILGFAALLAGCDDGEQRQNPETCVTVVYAACLPVHEGGLKCALLGEGRTRLDVWRRYPIIEGDEVCGQWKWVTP